MARAAAKRRQPTHHHDDRRKHKDSGGQRFEDTLFFNRLRKHAKWVFVFLAIVFAGSFVVFGVGSSSLGLGDIFNSNGGGGSGQPSVSKALKATAEEPEEPQGLERPRDRLRHEGRDLRARSRRGRPTRRSARRTPTA